MDVFKAVILGFIQGLTEFLPISSSGHLAILQHMLRVGEGAVAFDVVVHLGTLISVLIYFSREIKEDLIRGRESLYLALSVVVAEIPTSLMGLFLKDRIEQSFSSPVYVGVFFVITGLYLFLTKDKEGENGINPTRAFLIGVSQGFALFPGLSRSGLTIATAMLLGVDRDLSGKFSFYIFIPAVIGACLLELKGLPAGSLASTPFVAGFIVSLLVGLASLHLLMGFIRMGKFYTFSYYLVPLGVAVILLMG